MACCFDDLSVALVGFANERCGRLRRSTKLHMAGDQACDPYLRVDVNVPDGIKAIPERRPRITIEKEIVPFDDDDGVARAQPDAVWAWVVNHSVKVRYEDVVCCGSKSSNYVCELVSCESLRSALHPPQSTLFKGAVREVEPVHRCNWRSESRPRESRRSSTSRFPAVRPSQTDNECAPLHLGVSIRPGRTTVRWRGGPLCSETVTLCSEKTAIPILGVRRRLEKGVGRGTRLRDQRACTDTPPQGRRTRLPGEC